MKGKKDKKFPAFMGTHTTARLHQWYVDMAEREVDGNVSIIHRRALEEYVARHSNGGERESESSRI
jgi:hypothetical protein